MVLKGIDGALEAAAGAMLLASSRSALIDWVRDLTAPELREDPTDFIANHLSYWVGHLSARIHGLAGVYLLLSGVVKVAIVAAILRGWLRTYLWAMGVIGGFVVYLTYRAVLARSLSVGCLAGLDAVVVVLLAIEYSGRSPRASASLK